MPPSRDPPGNVPPRRGRPAAAAPAAAPAPAAGLAVLLALEVALGLTVLESHGAETRESRRGLAAAAAAAGCRVVSHGADGRAGARTHLSLTGFARKRFAASKTGTSVTAARAVERRAHDEFAERHAGHRRYTQAREGRAPVSARHLPQRPRGAAHQRSEPGAFERRRRWAPAPRTPRDPRRRSTLDPRARRSRADPWTPFDLPSRAGGHAGARRTRSDASTPTPRSRRRRRQPKRTPRTPG